MINIDDIFHFWKVIKIDKSICTCICIGCNKGTIKNIRRHTLLNGSRKSCGCKKQEVKKATCLEKYGVENYASTADCQDKMKQTCIEKYGVENYASTAACRDKMKQTCIEKYGVENTSGIKEVQDKKKQTWFEKYGVDHPLKAQQIKNKIKQTCLEKYGKTNPMQVDDVKEKSKQTCLEKYGVDHPLKNINVVKKSQETIRERYNGNHYMSDPSFKQKRQEDLLEKYGVDNPSKIKKSSQKKISTRLKHNNINHIDGKTIAEICREKKVLFTNAFRIFKESGEEAFLEYCNRGPKTSSLEILFLLLLKDIFPDIQHYNQFPFSLKYKPDFKLEFQNKLLFINLDGLYWHSILRRTKNYHQDLCKSFKEAGYVIFQFREDELRYKPEVVKSIVLNYFGIHNKKIHGRKCIIKEVGSDEAKKFFAENHLMGYASGKAYGLYFQNELVSLISIKKKDNNLDIIRFSNKNHYSVRGGFSKLLNYVTTKFTPGTITSFCDMRYSLGNSYELLGFEKAKETLGWNWTDFEQTYNRLKCRANMDDRKLTQEQHATELGWYQIYDAGQSKYIKIVKES